MTHLDFAPLPEGMAYAYSVTQEQPYYALLRESDAIERLPQLMIGVYGIDGYGCLWEFVAVEHQHTRGPALRVQMFYDSFVAYRDAAPLFAWLAAEQPRTLAELRHWLDNAGFRDATERGPR